MLTRVRTVAIVSTLIIVAGALSGCGKPTTGDGPGVYVPPPTTATPTFSTVWTDESHCPSTYPVALGMVPETADEARLLPSLDFCTGRAVTGFPYGKGFYLGNNDDTAVWVIDKPVLRQIPPATLPTEIAFFHDFLGQNSVTALTVEPHRTVSAAGVDPMDLHVKLDSSIQAAWQTLDLAVDTAQDKLRSTAETAAVKVVGIGSPTRKAMATCMLAGYRAGSAINQATNGKVSALEAALTLGSSTTNCGAAVHEVPPSSAKVVTEADLAAHARTSARWAAAEDVFEAAEKFLADFLKVVHRP